MSSKTAARECVWCMSLTYFRCKGCGVPICLKRVNNVACADGHKCTVKRRRLEMEIDALASSMRDRADDFGLMGKMSDERFERFVEKLLREFHSIREEEDDEGRV